MSSNQSNLSNQQYGNALDSTLPTHGQGSGYGTSGSHAVPNPTAARTGGGGYADAAGVESTGAGYGTAQILTGGAHGAASHGNESYGQQQTSHLGQHQSGQHGLSGLVGSNNNEHQSSHLGQHQSGQHGLSGLVGSNNNESYAQGQQQHQSSHLGGHHHGQTGQQAGLETSGRTGDASAIHRSLGTDVFAGLTSTGHVAPATNLTKNSNDPVTAPSTAGGSQDLNPHRSEVGGSHGPSSTTYNPNTSSNYASNTNTSHTGAYAATGAGALGAGALGAGALHGHQGQGISSGDRRTEGEGLPYGEKRTEGTLSDNKGLPTGAGDGPTAALKDTLGFNPKTHGDQTGVSNELPEPKHVESMSQGPHGLVWQESTQSYVHRRELDGKGSTGVPLVTRK